MGSVHPFTLVTTHLVLGSTDASSFFSLCFQDGLSVRSLLLSSQREFRLNPISLLCSISIWDHRSSKKLACLYTDPPAPFYRRPNSTSQTPSIYQKQHELASSSTSIFATSHTRNSPYYNPRSSTTTSSSNLSPARVVKFSPSSSSKELIVYTDDTSNLYIADGRTFDQRISLPIPHGASGEEEKSGLSLEQRHARLSLLQEEDDHLSETVEVTRNLVGTSGVCFSPCGGWLYAGTEAGIGEWEVTGGRQGWKVEGDGKLA